VARLVGGSTLRCIESRMSPSQNSITQHQSPCPEPLPPRDKPLFVPILPAPFPRLAYLLTPIIPPKCLVCHRALRPVFPVTPLLCRRCTPSHALVLDPQTLCPRCGLTLMTGSCERCFLFPLPFSSVGAPFPYRGAIRDLVRAMKYTPSRKLAKLVAQMMARAIGDEAQTATQSLNSRLPWDLVVPIPSGPHSSKKRLFTPAYLAAREIARTLSLPLSATALAVNRTRSLQASLLSTTARFRNSRDAFTSHTTFVEGKHILLIDDVITTGATIAAAAKVLSQAGAREIAVRAFAVSDRYERTRAELYRFVMRGG
jgi:ComF family protein